MIRRAGEKDLARVNELLSQVLTVHAEIREDIFIPGTRKYKDEELLSIFTDDNRPVFVYTDSEDTTLGYCFCILEETKNCNNMHDMLTLYIDDLCVDERYRHQGIAKQLFAYVKEYAKSIGCYHITLNVWEGNDNARRFYESMGMGILKTVMEYKL